MGMYDEFIPVPALGCVKCEEIISCNWQSKDLDCILSVWQQGQANPVQQDYDLEIRPNLEVYLASELPNGKYEIYTSCTSCGHWNVAIIEISEGVWINTRLNPDWPNKAK